MKENDVLNWDTPNIPHEYANAVVMEKTVVLVRHHFADTGDVETIFNEYIEEKTG